MTLRVAMPIFDGPQLMRAVAALRVFELQHCALEAQREGREFGLQEAQHGAVFDRFVVVAPGDAGDDQLYLAGESEVLNVLDLRAAKRRVGRFVAPLGVVSARLPTLFACLDLSMTNALDVADYAGVRAPTDMDERVAKLVAKHHPADGLAGMLAGMDALSIVQAALRVAARPKLDPQSTREPRNKRARVDS